MACKKQVALIIRLPLASGLLSGNLNSKTTFASNDHRNFNRNGDYFNVGETFSGLPLEKGLEIVSRLEPLIPDDLSLPLASLRWILDFAAVSVVIPGSKSPNQVQHNSRASNINPLSASFHQTLKQFYKRDVAPHIRGKY